MTWLGYSDVTRTADVYDVLVEEGLGPDRVEVSASGIRLVYEVEGPVE